MACLHRLVHVAGERDQFAIWVGSNGTGGRRLSKRPAQEFAEASIFVHHCSPHAIGARTVFGAWSRGCKRPSRRREFCAAVCAVRSIDGGSVAARGLTAMAADLGEES